MNNRHVHYCCHRFCDYADLYTDSITVKFENKLYRYFHNLQGDVAGMLDAKDVYKRQTL